MKTDIEISHSYQYGAVIKYTKKSGDKVFHGGSHSVHAQDLQDAQVYFSDCGSSRVVQHLNTYSPELGAEIVEVFHGVKK